MAFPMPVIFSSANVGEQFLEVKLVRSRLKKREEAKQ
jgi:hypothetical protein